MSEDTAPVKGQNAKIVFAWGTVRPSILRWRHVNRVRETTGSGSGKNAQFVEGVDSYTIQCVGVLVNGVQKLATLRGRIKIDWKGDNSVVYDCPSVVLSTLEIELNLKSGDIIVRFVGVVDGAVTELGTTT